MTLCFCIVFKKSSKSKRGIDTTVQYPRALPEQACYALSAAARARYPEAAALAREALSLPIYPELTDAQQDRVVAAVKEFFA